MSENHPRRNATDVQAEIAFALNEHPHIVGPRRYRYHVFCTRTPESFAAARAERLKVAGNPSQYADLQVFIQEQKVMRRLVGESILPTLELDISDNDVHKASDRIADWLAETGGFWAPTL